MAWTDLLGAGLDFLGGREVNKSNQKRDAANIAATTQREANLKDSSENFNSAFLSGDNAGGFANIEQSGDKDAAAARDDLAFGDINRAGNINNATGNFGLTLPGLSDAQGIIDRDRELNQASIIEPGLNKLATQNQRTFGGINNSSAGVPFANALKELFQSTQIGGEQDAINLFQGSQKNDLANLQQTIAANALHAPAPGFQSGGPSSTGQLLAQTPVANAQFSNIGSGGLAALAGSNALSQMATRQANENALSRMLASRNIGDSGGFTIGNLDNAGTGSE